jgi:hypothetical protein
LSIGTAASNEERRQREAQRVGLREDGHSAVEPLLSGRHREDPCEVPTISRFYGITIRMYFADHAPPHFHAVYAGAEAVIAIATGEVLRGAFPERPCGWCENGRRSIATSWPPTGSERSFPRSRRRSHRCHERTAYNHH